MPSAPPRVCARCGQLAQRGQPCTCRPAYEGSTHPGSDRRWRATRQAQLRRRPLCQHPGCRRPAQHVDHIVPLAEGGARYDYANLQSLCEPHHDEKTTRDALRGKTRTR